MKKTISFTNVLIVILSLILVSCSPKNFNSAREFLDLSGIWNFEIDSTGTGIKDKWYLKKLNDSLQLPGSMDENGKGNIAKDTSTDHLNRSYTYAGMAWYKKIVDIPESWSNKHLELILERTKVTHVWIDSFYVGTNNSIFTKQIFDITQIIKPGSHTLTILVDNNPKLLPIDGSHAYSEDTQTNWNGIIGKIGIEASEKTRIASIKTYPDIQKRQILLKARILHEGKKLKGSRVCIKTLVFNSRKHISIPDQWFVIPELGTDTTVEFVYNAGENLALWSEFKPVYCKLSIEIYAKNVLIDNQILDVGLREFKTVKTQFSINGLTTFLRGKHDACVFPMTGYPAMDVESWVKLFEIAKDYGINHYRFHSWTPPEAAFEAADRVGIYLQPELPIWYAFFVNDSSQRDLMLKYGKEILDAYANHPSFVMFALGNEIWQERPGLESMIKTLRQYDSRPLYAQGSNNRLWDPYYAVGDDYWTSARTGKETENFANDIRSSFAHLDSKQGGILNTMYPNTQYTYEQAITNSPVPVIGHEIGQYQVYPPFETEIPKYKGVLKPLNLEIFRQRLEKNGMLDQADDFFEQSGALAVICYKAEIEAAMRTKGFGGFQLLDLQDYPGQGTALVGVLDAFMQNKGLISPEKFREFCNRTVVLCKIPKYCWNSGENFSGEIDLANYSTSDISGKMLTWELISDEKNNVIAKGEYELSTIKQGVVGNIGSVSLILPDVDKATKFTLNIEISKNVAKNEYPVWIYPVLKDTMQKSIIAKELNARTEAILKQGGVVILTPDFEKIKDNSVPGQFIPEFWNYKMFTKLAVQYKGQISPGTMGILTDPKHPVFNEFPTEKHSDWQWWTIAKNSRPIILDKTEINYRPIIQVIDNIDRNHKLGMLFEYKCEKGKILICPVAFDSIAVKPEGKQFIKSIIDYAHSESFTPTTTISLGDLRKLLYY